jgi:hypothetical protein
MAKSLTVTPAVEKVRDHVYIGSLFFVEVDEDGEKVTGYYSLVDHTIEAGCRIALQAKMRTALPKLFPPDAVVLPIKKIGCRRG